jgi:hypothetical protein
MNREDSDTELSERLGAGWREALSLNTVAAEDHFFHSGGSSVMAARMISRQRRDTGRRIPLRLIFDHPTFGAYCRAVSNLVA